MSLPSFPNIDPPIQRENAVNQILSSIAMEELSLSHILNTEGEKLQYILGALPGLSGPAATVEDVLSANESVRNLLKTAVQNQLFLRSKMQGALEASPMQGPAGHPCPACPDCRDRKPTGRTVPTGAAALLEAHRHPPALPGPTGPTGPTGRQAKRPCRTRKIGSARTDLRPPPDLWAHRPRYHRLLPMPPTPA